MKLRVLQIIPRRADDVRLGGGRCVRNRPSAVHAVRSTDRCSGYLIEALRLGVRRRDFRDAEAVPSFLDQPRDERRVQME